MVDPSDENHSPYSYVGNRVLIAVDPSGERTWFVHGTGSGPERWKPGAEGTGNWAAVFGETDKQTTKFDWSVPTFLESNQSFTRQRAAVKLAGEFIAFKKDNPDEPINIVAHSHGGNVAIMAANIIKEAGYKVDNLIIFGTPENGSELAEGAADMFVAVYTEDDAIQVSGGKSFQIPFVGEAGPAGRKHKGAFNLPVTNVEGVADGPDNPHSNMDQNPWVVNAISSFLNFMRGDD